MFKSLGIFAVISITHMININPPCRSARTYQELMHDTLGSNKSLCDNRKTKCGEMKSCSEAMFYFKICGLNRLDRDNDDVPCESICGFHR